MTPTKIIVVFCIMLGIGFYALSLAHDHDNSEWCKRSGGPDAFYSGGSCWIPMKRVDS